jgi:hypothetical protein
MPLVRNLDDDARARCAADFFDAIPWDADDVLPDPATMSAAEFLDRLMSG